MSGHQLSDGGPTIPPLELPYNKLQEIAQRCGLLIIGVIPVAEAEAALAQEARHLGQWQQLGYGGEMRYMLRPLQLFSQLRSFLPEVVSVLSFSVPYSAGPELGLPPGHGRIARYAWGNDYHRVLREKARDLVSLLKEEYPAIGENLRWRGFSDSVPILERAIGTHNALGFIGKNTMLIRPGVGSFTFLGEILWNVAVLAEEASSQWREALPIVPGSGCGTCERCIVGCPTGAIVAPGKLDARKCISYLTIEKKGAFSLEQQIALGEWIFGCDVCQEVCPFNHVGTHGQEIKPFSPEAGIGPFLDLRSVLSIRTKAEFEKRFGGTPLTRPGREGLARNACAVAANLGVTELISDLHNVISDDSSVLVRNEAYNALARLLDVVDGLERKRVLKSLAEFGIKDMTWIMSNRSGFDN